MKLESALLLADMGFHVFPICPLTKIPPKGFHFKEKATQNKEQIKEWWTNGYSDFNTGIFTEKFKEEEALLVVDVDQKEGKMGEDELLRLELKGMDFPTTLEQKTPGGGRHLIYKTNRAVRQSVGRLAPGIDIRSRGGYIVGPGSVLKNGTYVLTNREIVEAPQWLVSFCDIDCERSEPIRAKIVEGIDAENALNRARHYLQNEAPIAIQGQGGDQTTFTVAARVKDFGVEIGNALDSMTEWNSRCEPPWAINELEEKIRNAYSYGKNIVGADSPEAVFKAVEITGKGLKEKLLHEINPNFKQQYLVEKLLNPGSMSVVYGKSGSCKTFFALDLSLHIALGQKWQDRKIKSGAVIYVAAEGGFGIQKRIKAFRQFHKIEERSDVPFALVDSAIDIKKDAKELVELVKRVETHFKTKSALIVIDTLFRAFGDGNENDAEAMGLFVKWADEIKRVTGAHLMLIHHSGKNEESGARGHSSLRAATDTEIFIKDMVAIPKKQRDMEHGPDIGFRLEQIAVGVDIDGNVVNSCVVLPSNSLALKDFSKEPLDDTTQIGKAFIALQGALAWAGQLPADDMELPDELLMVSIEDWKKSFVEKFYPQSKRTTYTMAFTRAVSSLVDSGRIGKKETYYWIK